MADRKPESRIDKQEMLEAIRVCPGLVVERIERDAKEIDWLKAKSACLQLQYMEAEKQRAELQAVQEIVKEIDARFGHFRKLKGIDKSSPAAALGEVMDIIHRAAAAVEGESA